MAWFKTYLFDKSVHLAGFTILRCKALLTSNKRYKCSYDCRLSVAAKAVLTSFLACVPGPIVFSRNPENY